MIQKIQLGKALSPEQQRKVKGGTVDPGTSSCITTMKCSVFDSSTGKNYDGKCGMVDLSAGGKDCICETDLGEYTPINGVGTSSCWGD